MKIIPMTLALFATASVGFVATTSGPSAAGPSAAGPVAVPVSCSQPGPYQLPQGHDPVQLNPADFTVHIDNPYWPMRPGTAWHYIETSGGETAHVTTTVTHKTKVIYAVTARVVHDVVRSGGEVVEDTLDWYAQDSGGSIWYLGELSKTYEHGNVVSTEGSWTYGKDGGQAGVIVPATPQVGCGYREEFHAGDAEDQAAVLSTAEPLRTPTGFHRNVLHTANTTPLTPDALENKFYARGIGPVLELDLSPDLGRAVLVRVTHRH
jgi:hypothetical protein